MSSITQSMLGNADNCLRQFQYALQHPVWVRQVGGADRAIGTGFHAGLAWYYTQRIDNPSALPDTEGMIQEAVRVFNVSTGTDLYTGNPIDEFKWSDRVPDFAAAEKLLGELIDAYVRNEWWLGLEHTILAVELNEHFTDPDSGRTFKLGADLVSRLGDTLRLTDHKTAGKAWSQGKESPRKQNQSPLYTWAARQRWPKAAVVQFAFDIITYPGPKTPVRFERRITTPTPAHEHAVVSKALDLMNLYETVVQGQGRDLPANPASVLCNPKWCDYWDGCPHGAELDKADDVLVISSSITPLAKASRDVSERQPTTVAPTEGAAADDVDVDALRDRYKALTPYHRTWLEELREQANKAGVDFHLSRRTERRYNLMLGLVSLAERPMAEAEDDTIKALARHVLADDTVAWPATPAGAAVGMCDHAQAHEFRVLCQLVAGGEVRVEDGEVVG